MGKKYIWRYVEQAFDEYGDELDTETIYKYVKSKYHYYPCKHALGALLYRRYTNMARRSELTGRPIENAIWVKK